MADVEALAKAVAGKHARLDVLINNAGVFSAPDPVTKDGLDVRFAVNTVAPYLLTQAPRGSSLRPSRQRTQLTMKAIGLTKYLPITDRASLVDLDPGQTGPPQSMAPLCRTPRPAIDSG